WILVLRHAHDGNDRRMNSRRRMTEPVPRPSRAEVAVAARRTIPDVTAPGVNVTASPPRASCAVVSAAGHDDEHRDGLSCRSFEQVRRRAAPLRRTPAGFLAAGGQRDG